MEVRLDLSKALGHLDPLPLRTSSAFDWIYDAFVLGRREAARVMYDSLSSRDKEELMDGLPSWSPEIKAAILRFATSP